MAREVGRAPPIRDNFSIKAKRRLEVLLFLLPAILIVIGTVGYFSLKQMLDYKKIHSCSSNSTHHIEDITEAVPVGGYLSEKSLKTEDGLVYPPGSYWTSSDGNIWGCPCLIRPCIYKCCGKEMTHFYKEAEHENITGYEYNYEEEEDYRQPYCNEHNVSFNIKNRKVFSSDNISPLTEVVVNDNHFLIVNDACLIRYPLFKSEDENAFLLNDGRLYRNDSPVRFWEPHRFCAETSNESPDIHFMICHQKESQESTKRPELDWMHSVRGGGMLISVPFLFATVIIYALLPALQNLHGKSLICHVSSMTVAYSGLTYIQLSDQRIHLVICKVIGFTTYSSLMATFFWLNVMCFDIWWVFSGMMPLRGSQSAAEQVKFRLYSLYAWGCPLLLLAILLLMDFSPGTVFSLKPQIGDFSCFLKEGDPRLLYLYLPIGVLVYFNIVMFFTTALRFKSHSKSVKRLERGDSRRHCQADKATSDMQRFSLYLKLFIVMGLNWVLELMSFFADSGSIFWLIVDVSNGLQGLVIFYMFACKRQILVMLNQKFFPSSKTKCSVKTISSARSCSSGKLSSIQCKVNSGTEYQCSISGTESSACIEKK